MTESVAAATDSAAPGRPGPGHWSLLEDLDRRAERDPDGRAVVCVDVDGIDHTLTWAELVAGSEAVAIELLALGVRPGDPVAYQLPNRLEFLTITLGALSIASALYVILDLDTPFTGAIIVPSQPLRDALAYLSR